MRCEIAASCGELYFDFACFIMSANSYNSSEGDNRAHMHKPIYSNSKRIKSRFQINNGFV